MVKSENSKKQGPLSTKKPALNKPFSEPGPITPEETQALLEPPVLHATRCLNQYRLAQVKRPAPIVNLVLKGGGVLGTAYAGALRELEAQGKFQGVERVAGSSAGGLIAIFIALGFSAQRIEEIMLELNYNHLLANPETSIPRKIWNYFSTTLSSYGPDKLKKYFAPNLDDGQLLENKLKDYIQEALSHETHKNAIQALGIKNLKEVTFKELQEIRQYELKHNHCSSIKKLYLTGTNKTLNKRNNLPKGLTYFSHEHDHAQNMPIARAGLITASHPFAYHCVNYGGNMFTDGAVADACPVSFFDDPKYASKENPLDVNNQNPETLAMLVDSEYDIKKQAIHHTKDTWLNRVLEFFYQIFRRFAFSGLFDPKVDRLREENHTRILQIYDCNINQLDFEITPEKKQALILQGSLAMRRHLRNYYSEDCFLPDDNFGKDTIPVSEKQIPYKSIRSYNNFQKKYTQVRPSDIKHIIQYELKPAIAQLENLKKAIRTYKRNLQSKQTSPYYCTDYVYKKYRNTKTQKIIIRKEQIKRAISQEEYIGIINSNLALYRQELQYSYLAYRQAVLNTSEPPKNRGQSARKLPASP